jgi:hypothetical protein
VRRPPFVDPSPDRLQPGPAIGIGERLPGGHLLDVGRRVEAVGIGVLPAEATGQHRAHGGLAAAGDPGDQNDRRVLLVVCRHWHIREDSSGGDKVQRWLLNAA